MIIPKIDSFSEVKSRNYEPSKLLDEKDYYCSRNPSNEFIIFDFLNEYFFNGFKMTFLLKNENCRPNYFIVSILDDKKNVKNIFPFFNDNIQSLSREYDLKNKGRYLKFDFKNNYGGKYIIIKHLEFYTEPIDSVQYK